MLLHTALNKPKQFAPQRQQTGCAISRLIRYVVRSTLFFGAALFAMLPHMAHSEAHGHTLISSRSDNSCRQLSALQWLKGHWQAGQKRAIVTESWNIAPASTATAAPENNHQSVQAWHGTGETTSLKTHRVLSRERMLIHRRSNGDIVYDVWLNQASAPVSFLLTTCGSGSVTFNNPEHDFPNQLHYQQIGNNAIQARVTDNAGKGFTLNFHRVNPAR